MPQGGKEPSGGPLSPPLSPPCALRSQLYNDVHILDTSVTPAVWHSPHFNGSWPPGRSGHSSTLLEDDISVVVFGGDGGTSSSNPSEGYLNDVWTYEFNVCSKRASRSLMLSSLPPPSPSRRPRTFLCSTA